MSKLIVLAVFLAAVSAAWVWLRRRRVVKQPQEHGPSIVERSAVDESQSTPVTVADVTTMALPSERREATPDVNSLNAAEHSAPASPQPKPRAVEPEGIPSQPAYVLRPEVEPSPPEPTPAVIQVSVIAQPSSPDVPILATTEATSSENRTSVSEPEEVLSTPISQLLASTSDELTAKPSDASQHKPLTSETKAPALSSGLALHQSEPAAQLSKAGEALVESGVPSSAAMSGEAAAPPTPSCDTGTETSGEPEPPPAESKPTQRAPYRPPIPAAQTPRTSVPGRRAPRVAARTESDLGFRIQLVFGRGGGVKTLALVPDRRDGMPSDIEVIDTQGSLPLNELREDCYEPVPLTDPASILQQGVEWRGRGDAQRWRWVLRERELYVLAPGNESGLHGFVSRRKGPRLRLNAKHVVLARTRLREQVLAALSDAGCAFSEVCDDGTPGVPSGWLLIREVTPTRSVSMRDDADPLNVLCPAHEIEPHFVGGIRVKGNVWLAGFPPRIRFTGELGSGFRVVIDGQPAQRASEGAFEAPGWDAEGEHRLWFGDRFETYWLRTMDEGWEHWHAHDFGTGAAICGASTQRIDGASWWQIRIPVANPLLVGAQTGEIFCCQARPDVRSETILALVPFAPVWALPTDPAHADKRSARLVLLNSMEPVLHGDRANPNKNRDQGLRRWIAAINDAGRKQLALAAESDAAKALWRRYRAVAKQLWRKLR